MTVHNSGAISFSLIIALFPLILEAIRFGLDQMGLAGEALIERLVEVDKRDIILRHLKNPTDGKELLEAVRGLFRFGEKTNFIIRAHIAFLISLYFASLEKTQEFITVSGWPLIAMAVAIFSLLVFLIRLHNIKGLRAGGKFQLPYWQVWNGVLWALIICGEAYDHLSHA
jgi:hypothetical protein